MNTPHTRQSRDPFAQLQVNACEDRIAAGSLFDPWLGMAAPDPILPEMGDPNGLVSIGQRSVMTTWTGDRLGSNTERWDDSPVQVDETKIICGSNQSEPASSKPWVSIADPLALDALPGVSPGGATRDAVPPGPYFRAADVSPSTTDTAPASMIDGVYGEASAALLQQSAEPPFHGVFVAPTAVALGGGTGPPATQVSGGTIREVTFSGSGLITVEADPGDPAYPAPPHWLDSDTNGVLDQSVDRALPVGYSRGDTAQVSAVFTANFVDPNLLLPGYAFTSPQVRGDGPGSYDVPATSVAVQGTDLVLGPTDLYAPFADQVAYFGAFTISWETSLVVNTTTGERVWDPAGTSSNELFVTLASPDVSPVWYSPIYHFCSAAAGGKTEEETILSAWQKFADRNVEKVTKNEKGQETAREKLHYYKDWSLAGPNHMKAEDLLKNKDGTCYSWAHYLRMVLQAGGVKNTAIEPYFIASATAPESVHMLIKDWDFVGNGTSGNPQYPYQNTLKSPTIRPLQNPASIMESKEGVWSYVWGNTVEMKDKDGVAGQGTANPRSLFQNHIVVRLGGIDFYDPSYGAKYASIQAWEDAALVGLVAEQVDNPGPTFRLVGRKPNAGVPDVAYEKRNWW